MSAAQSSMPANPLTTWARYGLIAFAWLFAAGGIVQIFLAGLAVFEPAEAVSHWNDHVDFGRMIGFLAYLLPVFALVGRAGVRLVGQAFVVAILFVVQSILPNVDEAWVAALHPVNGFFLVGAAGSLGGAVLGLVRASTRSTASAAPQPPEHQRIVS
jgi:hypothetical protein